MSTLQTRLLEERCSLIATISTAAGSGDTQAILRAASRLREVEQAVADYQAFERRAERVLAPERGPGEPQEVSAPVRLPQAGGRGVGARLRHEFVERVRSGGTRLDHLAGSVYKADGGNRVGIAVATERRSDRWFLGLSEGEFDTAALLCQTQAGRTMAVCLSRGFFARYGQALSRSGGQVKFNLVRRGEQLAILVPGHEPVAVDAWVDAVERLTE